MRTRFFPLLALLLCLLLAWPAAGSDEDKPVIADITLTASGGKLLLSAAVKHSFTKEMLEGVHNALPITFRFKVSLERVRSYWLDQSIAELGINHTLSYDPIRREYQVACSEKEQPSITRSLDEAQRMMAELKRIDIAQLTQLYSGASYILHVKATLEENTFPLGIHSIIPFTSLWNFETDWRVIEFIY
ncbi:DUF4390 domain-containing protein [Candidatus Electronema sp. PJ]|uniref:DUF4390 domain-containing protein n=1 Tax=Candidatus Electronema sp. PJ TaxID=3401572 RepID=UPI003AA8F43C